MPLMPCAIALNPSIYSRGLKPVRRDAELFQDYGVSALRNLLSGPMSLVGGDAIQAGIRRWLDACMQRATLPSS